MYLSELKLWNFRKFGSSEPFDRSKPNLIVPFQKGLNLLVGENDSGKTAIVDAIKYVLLTNSREYIRLEIEDFYNHHLVKEGEEQTLRIECYFKFKPNDHDSKAKNFLDWGHFNEKKELELRIFLEVKQKEGKIEPYDIRGGIENEGIVLDARARELLRITYLKPLRDAKEELKPKKGSRLSQVLDSHSTFGEKENHFLSKTVKFANKEIASFFRGDNPHHHNLLDEIKLILGSETSLIQQIEEKFNPHLHSSSEKGDELAKQINAYLTNFFGTNTSSQFSISETNLKGILERLSLHLDSTNAGLGSHNLLFIAVELLLLEKEDDFTGLRLALIEEIEAHLHPQAQMRLVEYLQKECSDKGVQMLLTTHSPNLASKVKLENLIICQDKYAYPMGSDYTMLEKGDYTFLERFLDVTKANLFFAKGVILVEGDAENLLLPTIAKIIDCGLTQSGVSIVKISNTAFNRYVPIFLRKKKNGLPKEMNILVAVITDMDVKPFEYYDDTKNLPKYYELNKELMQDFITAKCLTDTDYEDYSDILDDYENLTEIKYAVMAVINDDKQSAVNSFFTKDNTTAYRKEIDISGISDYIQQKKDKKKGYYANKQKVEYHLAEHWTLEYVLALSTLKNLFYAAILMAKKEKFFVESKLEIYKSKADEKIGKWNTEFGTDKPNEKIAYEIYGKAMNGRGTSKIKAITAQIFAEILEMEMKDDAKKAELKTQLLADKNNPILYLVDAIKHATSKS
jgi:putative ATP-dependent endonuclease of the OLD family